MVHRAFAGSHPFVWVGAAIFPLPCASSRIRHPPSSPLQKNSTDRRYTILTPHINYSNTYIKHMHIITCPAHVSHIDFILLAMRRSLYEIRLSEIGIHKSKQIGINWNNYWNKTHWNGYLKVLTDRYKFVYIYRNRTQWI